MTNKPISTISYNSEAFLLERLEKWRSEHKIQTYMYICHVGEDGDKNHIHLRIEPNCKLDPMNLSADLEEIDPNHEKPLGCRPWRPSVEEDWFLYVIHDKEYLKLKYGGGDKGEKIPYDWHKIVVPDNYDLEVAIVRAYSHLEHTTAKLAERLANGENALQLISEGENVFQVNACKRALSENDYDRLRREYDYLYAEHEKLKQAIQDKKLTVVITKSGYKLE